MMQHTTKPRFSKNTFKSPNISLNAQKEANRRIFGTILTNLANKPVPKASPNYDSHRDPIAQRTADYVGNVVPK